MSAAFFDALVGALGAIMPLLIAVIVLALLVSFGPRAITAWRQRAYDAAIADEMVRLELTPVRGASVDPAVPVAFIRSLHPRDRRGADGWGLGWPPIELLAVWRDGCLVWQIDCPRQSVPGIQTTLRPLYPGLELRPATLLKVLGDSARYSHDMTPTFTRDPADRPSEPARALAVGGNGSRVLGSEDHHGEAPATAAR